MIEFTSADFQEIILELFGCFILGYCVGYTISIFKKFWSSFS